MNASSPPLVSLASIFRGIKAGHHWSFGDPDYSELNERFDDYHDFFAAIDLKLHRDGRGFIFATSNDDDYKGSDQITRFVVFTSVWVDAIADTGGQIDTKIFTTNQYIADLPHLGGESYRRLLNQVGIASPDELQSTLKSMERLGLVEFDGQNRFSVRPSFHRLLDVCLDEGRRAQQAPDATVEETESDRPEDSL